MCGEKICHRNFRKPNNQELLTTLVKNPSYLNNSQECYSIYDDSVIALNFQEK